MISDDTNGPGFPPFFALAPRPIILKNGGKPGNEARIVGDGVQIAKSACIISELFLPFSNGNY